MFIIRLRLCDIYNTRSFELCATIETVIYYNKCVYINLQAAGTTVRAVRLEKNLNQHLLSNRIQEFTSTVVKGAIILTQNKYNQYNKMGDVHHSDCLYFMYI